MKTLLTLIFLITLASNCFAQSKAEFFSHFSRIRGYRGEIDFKKLESVINLAQKIADRHSIISKQKTLINNLGQKYPVLIFSPNRSSRLGLEVTNLKQNHGNIELIYSPYDLVVSKSNAFFKPDGSMIGAPKEAIFDELNSSYFHEKMHADTYRKLILKDIDTYAGSMRLLKGDSISKDNHGGYFKRASLDEILTTEFSALEGIKSLYKNYRTQSYDRFIKSAENEEQLAKIKNDLENLIGLAKQNLAVASEIKSALKSSRFNYQRTSLELGRNLSRPIFDINFHINSDERVYINGRGIYKKVKNGTAVNLKSLTLNPQKLVSRFDKIEKRSKEIFEAYQKALSYIGVRIMYADLKTTDFENLFKLISK